MKFCQYILWNLVFIVFACGQNQSTNSSIQQSNQFVGGPCEGCEAIFEYEDKVLNWVDTLPDYLENENKMVVEGTIYQSDGKTPATDVILYVYQTDKRGIYPTKGNESNWARRHGYIRQWLKTSQDGKYKFYTFRPASYPNTTVHSHIHPVIKEPNKNEYYIDEFIFDDDTYLTETVRANLKNRSGSGILKGTQKGDLMYYKRDIILGLNIPDYRD